MPRAIVSQLRCVLGILGLVITAGAPATVRADTVYAVSNNDGRIIRYDSTNPAGSVVTLSGTGALLNAAGLALGPEAPDEWRALRGQPAFFWTGSCDLTGSVILKKHHNGVIKVNDREAKADL